MEINTNGVYSLRTAGQSDMELLFGWINDDDVRRNAFDEHLISKEEHEKWFSKAMTNQNVLIYILMLNDKPIGQCRLTINNGIADIDYSIDKAMRGRGIGKIILDLTEREVRENCTNIKKLIGRVKPKNTASVKCFERNGYSKTSIVFEKEIAGE